MRQAGGRCKREFVGDVEDFKRSMTFGGEFGFWVSGFDISSFKPDKLVNGKGLGWCVGSFSFHDFRSNVQGGGDFNADLFEGFKSVFNRRNAQVEVDRG